VRGIFRYFFAVLLAAAAVDGAASAHSTPNKALATPTKAPVVRIESGLVRGLEADGIVARISVRADSTELIE
jgi:hypothetical protein